MSAKYIHIFKSENEVSSSDSNSGCSGIVRRDRCTGLLMLNTLGNENGNRDCLAEAVLQHIPELVDAVDFADSDMPDILVQDGYLTDAECVVMRSSSNRKDQVRQLIITIKGRKFDAIMGFLDAVHKAGGVGTNAVISVYNKYNSMIESGSLKYTCVVCKIKNDVDVSRVADCLVAKHRNIISESRYKDICKHEISSENAWSGIFKKCNDPKKLKALCTALSKDDLYTHYIDELQRLAENRNYEIECGCSDPPLVQYWYNNLRFSSWGFNIASSNDPRITTSYDDSSKAYLSSTDTSVISPLTGSYHTAKSNLNIVVDHDKIDKNSKVDEAVDVDESTEHDCFHAILNSCLYCFCRCRKTTQSYNIDN